MLKDITIFFAIVSLCCAASLYSEDDSGETSTTPEPCLYEKTPWPTADLTGYNYCMNGVTKTMKCRKNHYFVMNEKDMGCVPASRMDPKCVNLNISVGPCTGQNLKQMQKSEVLTNFWLCEQENAPPVELPCPNGQAFVKQDGYLGCFDWTEWRKLRDCN